MCDESRKKRLLGKDFIRLYQKTGWTDFNELQVTDSTLNKGTNSHVTSESGGKGWFVGCGHTKECHKTHNGWYSGMVVLLCWYIDSTYIVRTY